MPPPTSHVVSQTASRNQRSCVTTSSAPRRPRRCRGQPVDALDVEMVRRLVEHQQIDAVDGIGDEQGAERSAAPLAAGHDGQPGVQPVAQPQPVEHLAGRGIARPLVLGEPGEQQLADGQVGQRVVLGEQRDPDPGARRDPARSRVPPGRR